MSYSNLTNHRSWAVGYRVSKGSWLTVSPYAIQNDPRVWGPDAHVFRPERWLTQDPVAAKNNKRGFFAFGHGPRVCPGSRFAIIEMKLALIRVFQAFTLELLPNQVSAPATAILYAQGREEVFWPQIAHVNSKTPACRLRELVGGYSTSLQPFV